MKGGGGEEEEEGNFWQKILNESFIVPRETDWQLGMGAFYKGGEHAMERSKPAWQLICHRRRH